MDPQGRAAGENPFESGWGLSRAPLLAREGELARGERVAESGGVLFVLGPAGHGKTALLQALTERLNRVWGVRGRADPLASGPASEALPIWLEGRGASGPLAAAARLVQGVIGDLASSPAEAASLLRTHFGSLSPVLRESSDGPALALSPAAGTEAGEAFGLALDGARAASRAVSRRLVLVVDALDVLVADGALARALAGRLAEPEDGGYVLAGRPTRAVRAMLAGSGALGDVGVQLELGPVNEMVFSRFVESGFRSAGLQVEAAAVAWLMELMDGVPAAVQRLAGACWEAVRAGPGRLTRGVIEETARDVALEADAFYSTQWSTLTPSQRRTLVAVAQERGVDLFASGTSARYGVPTPTIQSSLRALDDRGLVWSSAAEGRWRLADPLLGEWLRVVGAA